ncbi:MAG: HAMP domain-containing histidine kinase [Clostridiales Family XIII bacterium]|jgi:two-component system sensor histidine kinase VanS|nr:HAMP domain-containing histidine kinase [Clostridiales Family XIII bacterium]
MKNHGLFVKVFTYTVISVLLLVVVAAALFSGQFMLLFRTMQTRQIIASYQPLVERIHAGGDNGIAESARRFSARNQSFEFFVADKDGNPLYATPNADTSGEFGGDFYFVVHNEMDFRIIAQNRTGLGPLYREILGRIAAVLAIMLALCLACAFVFARRITRPIKALADATDRMARLEDVPPLPGRNDELGALGRDVHSMYERLKTTIAKLEGEILRERELEETQRYFFSAASHELKTPIAAATALLEGMIENVGDYKDHPKYLRECARLMDAQSRTISGMLEIVRLDDGKIVPSPEKLDIRGAVSALLPEFRTLAEANGLRMAIDIPEGQSCLADPQMLGKALSNLMLNAVQNTPYGHEIRIWSLPGADVCRLCILNTGARIDGAALPKLFAPFYRADKARSQKDGRSGLGLAIVQKTLAAMDITFALENAPDGVLFWMDLPKA